MVALVIGGEQLELDRILTRPWPEDIPLPDSDAISEATIDAIVASHAEFDPPCDCEWDDTCERCIDAIVREVTAG